MARSRKFAIKLWSSSRLASVGKKRIFVIIVGALVLSFGVGILMMIMAANQMPTADIPTPTIPENNAFDAFVDAYEFVKEHPELTEASEKILLAKREQRPLNSEEIALINDVSPDAEKLLARVREGMELEYVPPPIRSFDQFMPELAGFKETSKMINVQGHCYALNGEYEKAMDARLDGIRFGVMIGNERGVIDYLVGVAVVNIVREGAWDLVDNLDAAKCRLAALELQEIDATMRPFSDCMQEEMYSTQAGLIEVFGAPDWRYKLSAFHISSGGTEDGHNSFLAYYYTWQGKKRIFDSYTKFMQEEIDFYEGRRATRADTPDIAVVADILAVRFDQAGEAIYKTKALNRILATVLALRSYHLEHGVYPDGLDSLVIRYLASVPEDPYAKKAPLKYMKVGKEYLLYSIGPDRVDDNGSPIPVEPGNTSVVIRPDSLGDIVAGKVQR